jgi:hypothetical protein
MSQHKIKRTVAVLDYGILWQDWLKSGDQIATSTWTATPAGLTLSTPAHSINQATVWVSGGAAGAAYKLKNTITTSQGRTDVRELYINVIDP